MGVKIGMPVAQGVTTIMYDGKSYYSVVMLKNKIIYQKIKRSSVK